MNNNKNDRTVSSASSVNGSESEGRGGHQGKLVGKKRGKASMDLEQYILTGQSKVEQMKADLKHKSKRNMLTKEQRKLEANKISSLQARIRNKMDQLKHSNALEKNNKGLLNLLKIMMKKLDASTMQDIMTDLCESMGGSTSCHNSRTDLPTTGSLL